MFKQILNDLQRWQRSSNQRSCTSTIVTWCNFCKKVKNCYKFL